MSTELQTPADLELRRKLDLLLKTGRLLVESSADTARILRNMQRTAAFLGLPEQHLHIFVNYTMLMVNLSDEHHSYVKFQRCEKHGINMDAISAISKLSWKAIIDDYSLDQYEQELNQIKRKKRSYTDWQVATAAGFACGGFCVQFGCDWTAFFYASIAAILGMRLRTFLNHRGSNHYINIAVAAFISTILAWLSSFFSTDATLVSMLPSFMVSSTPWHPLLACALFIVPGVPIINFVSDMLGGYVQVGLVRFINTLLMVAAMAFGIAMAINVCGINNFVTNLSMTPHHEYWEFALAAAISAVGFSTIFNIPRRLLPVVAIGGVIAVCTRNFVNLGPSNGNVGLDMGLVAGSLVGSTLVSVIATQAMHWFHTPHHCLSIPSVIPMIPGVLMYRSLFAFIDMRGIVGEVTVAMHNGIMASLVTLCIAVGVAIPNIFFRRMLFLKRKKKLSDLLIQRRRLHGDFVDLQEVVEN
ncbi:threonine/serine exporter family protein [Prevotella sp.]|uniref:threonine/serine exporter family protein n=1 Tax=Prevotella sp. TaxID=59823 RepID=UPI002F953EB7